ncbi:MAG: CinA family nicotinamide mononucleotide deamidase-related protein [Rikenellaceae bacterium]|nr:CinA family nicotinamide mononucleotide deamidase-related protein [Rikenellaceae bacterium]
MKAQIVTIGDEILIGQIVDTNSAWLATELNKKGIAIDEIVSISDRKESIVETLDNALRTHDLVLVTGGLGPTKDDITKQSLCRLFRCGLKDDIESREHTQAMLLERGIPFTDLNRAQSLVPEVCSVLFNRNGTAPGMLFERDGHFLVSMPGVPYEMKTIFAEQLAPRLDSMFKLGSVYHKTMITTGIAESILAGKIAQWEDNLPEGLKLAYLPNPNGVRLRLSSYTLGQEQAVQAVDKAFGELEKIIPDNIIGFEGDTIESVVAGLLATRRQTLSVAESCTGGRIASRFTAMPGASEYFLGGVTSYSVAMKSAVLGVPAQMIEQEGVVSLAVAASMAEGVRRLTGSDFAIATTGVAGPTGGSEETPVGTVCMAVATPWGTVTDRRVFNSERQVTIERASAHVINMLREQLKNGDR